MNILLVDDNEELREFLALCLVETGVDVVTAESIGEGLRKSDAVRFDVIVIDSVLGTEDGLDLVEKIRASKNGKTTPILLMSSIPTALARRMATAAGCNEFLVKPFGQTQFIEQVRGLGRTKR
ncbi:transcriptional activator protein CzcR [Abditibacteriota bacterium]|nr:transcriptional activator protein CzcR [Abditibacteriota bacterium]